MPSMDLAGDVCYLPVCSQEICQVNHHPDFPEEKEKPREAQVPCVRGRSGSRNQDPGEQRPACPRTPAMRFGEDGFVLFSSIN